ncbi:MAG: D-alanyl-D-alanine carboxypeptidase [Ilumatobacteraceae bacterium]
MLLAVERGSTDCIDGLETEYELAGEAGLDTDDLFLVDGQGGDPASTTPRQVSRWMQWSREQPWGEAFVQGQPVLAETGSLAANGAGSPAAGKVAAKVGTSVSVDLVTGRLYAKVQSLAGYLTLDDGTVLVSGSR